MKSARLPLLALPSIVASLLVTSAVQESEPAASGGGVVTLYAQDDLQSSFDFRSGAGASVREGEVRLESAQIVFDVFEAGRITYGFAFDERVDILDLGDVTVPPEQRSRDRALEFPLSIFHTLSLTDEGFAIVRPGGDLDPYEKADSILGSLPLPALRHIEPCLGHVYLVRARPDRGSNDQFFKFQIIGLIPGHSLTMRWGPVPSVQ